MKETFYFSHDYNTRTNAKIKKLIMKFGYEGYGIFWALVEDLYNNANALRLDYDCIAFDLRTKSEIVKSIVEDFDLFQIQDGFIYSEGVQERLERRNEKSQKAKESALKRWNKPIDANALQTQSEGNAIKESKVNKNKGKKNKKDISELALAFNSDNFKNAWNEFLEYRKSKDKAVSYLAGVKIMNMFKDKNEQTAILMLETSIRNDWTGIFEQNNTKLHFETQSKKTFTPIIHTKKDGTPL